MDNDKHASWFEKRLLERFLRYVKFDTASDPHSAACPSTPGQRALAEELARELAAIGCEAATVDKNGYVYARLPGTSRAQPLVLIAHLDTSPEAPGKNVKPRVHEKYDGRIIALGKQLVLDPRTAPDLLQYIGGTIITSSGDTLLGADDKAGLAVIVTAAEFLHRHPEIAHGPVEIVFTPDEEIGRGADRFPFPLVTAKTGITVDGSEDGVIEGECFTAYRALVTVKGISHHPGEARGRLVNAAEIAAEFVSRVPKAESPQATDERYGYYAAMAIQGGVESATIEFIIRDFEDAGCQRRIRALRALAASLQAFHPGAKLSVKTVKQYANMKPYLDSARPDILPLLREAVRRTGIEPVDKSIRGGTDGARLSEQGLPCPNLFDGGYDYHSRGEWASLSAMTRSALTVVKVAELWSEGRGGRP